MILFVVEFSFNTYYTVFSFKIQSEPNKSSPLSQQTPCVDVHFSMCLYNLISFVAKVWLGIIIFMTAVSMFEFKELQMKEKS